MANLFDERIKRLEQEIDDIKTARQRLTGATSTVTKVITVKGWAIGQEYGRPYSVGTTVVTITPKDPSNGFFFNLSQPGVAHSGDWIFTYYTDTNTDITEFQAVVSFEASYDTWHNPDEVRAFTKQATIVASGQFEYSIEYREPTP